MPWLTPTLREVRMMVRDDVAAALSGAVMISNSVLRVMSDTNAGLAHLVLRYIDWLANQLMPDTAEMQWLDRHGDIWLVNADNSTGRKQATLSAGSVTLTGVLNPIVPIATQMSGGGVNFETIAPVTVGTGPTPVAIRALDAGSAGNLAAGTTLSILNPIAGLDGSATVVTLSGGTDVETDDELRARVLFRIQDPPMGGAAHDYVVWALEIPGVTRAWAAPNEMGMGTIVVRFMMDDLNVTTVPTTNGFPTTTDVAAVAAFLNTKRPVAVKDCFVQAPLPEPINFTVSNLSVSNAATQQAIIDSVTQMLATKSSPSFSLNGVLQNAPTIYAAWVSEAVLSAPGVESFDLVMSDHVMPDNGHMAVMGTVTFT